MQKYESYARTHLSGFLSVRSIITVFRMKLHHRVCGGESHDFPELVYVSSGPHTMKLDGTVHRLDQGQLMIYGPQAYHEGYEPSDAVLNIISFEAELPALFPFYNQIITLTQDQQSQISRIFSEGTAAFQNARAEEDKQGMVPRKDIPEYTLQTLKNRLELFLIDLYRNEAPSPSRTLGSNQENFRAEQFYEVRRFLSAHLYENLTLEEIAEGCSMSVSYLKRLSKQQCGCGPISLLINMKILEAKRMIRDNSFSITDISDKLGFRSVHYFSRLFKLKTGLSPSAYAKTIDQR